VNIMLMRKRIKNAVKKYAHQLVRRRGDSDDVGLCDAIAAINSLDELSARIAVVRYLRHREILAAAAAIERAIELELSLKALGARKRELAGKPDFCEDCYCTLPPGAEFSECRGFAEKPGSAMCGHWDFNQESGEELCRNVNN